MGLAHSARIGVCADDPVQIADLEAAAAEAGITLPVYVEINMGGNRCGVEPGEPALALARRIADASHLSFAGLQAYHGSAQHLRTWEERQKAIAASDEHGRLAITSATNRLKLGDKVKLVPGHCDPTVNLYDWYVGIRGERVAEVWPITARGAVY